MTPVVPEGTLLRASDGVTLVGLGCGGTTVMRDALWFVHRDSGPTHIYYYGIEMPSIRI